MPDETQSSQQVAKTLQDPEFTKLPLESRRRILSKVDPEFGKLGADSQTRILNKAAVVEPSIASRVGGRVLSTFGSAINPLPAARDVLTRAVKQPSLSDIALGPGAPLIKSLWQGAPEQFRKAGQMAGRTLRGEVNPIAGAAGTVMYGAGGALPGVGPTITGAVEEGLSKERGGAGRAPEAIGTLIGAGAAGPAAEYGLRGAGKLAAKTARPLYRSTLSFPEALDLPSRREAAEAGLSGIRARTTEGPKGLPRVDEFVRQKTAEVDAKIAEAERQGRKVDLRPVYKAVNEEVNSYAKSLAPDDPLAAASRIRDQIWKRLGAKEETIRIDTSMEPRKPQLEAPHIVKKPEPLYKEVKVLSPPAAKMKPTLGQEAKRATSHQLRKAYNEEKGAGIETLKAGERGLKEAMEGVADVKGPNWQEHVAITLRDAMERTLKRNPQFLDRYGMFILGGGALGTGAEILAGDLTKAAAAAGTSVASLLIEKALRNPATLSRMAIAMDRAGALAPDVAKVIRLQPALTLGQTVAPPLPPTRLQPEQTGQK